MDMRNQDNRRFHIRLDHQERFRFISQASEDGRLHGDAFYSDEPDPVGDAGAPATPALLGAAIGHCLSASLLETLRHAHLPVESFHTDVTAVVKPNGDGFPRIDHVEVVLHPRLREPSPRTGRCADVFEKHCTVSSSVRNGIDIQVRVDWGWTNDSNSGNGTRAIAEPLPAVTQA
jgi:organic hydroperoxide reductase OsmC/OhrA